MTQDMIVRVYWEGTDRDRAYVEACCPTADAVGVSGGGSSRGGAVSEKKQQLRLSIRVPTLAVVDANAATKFAVRLAQQVVIEVEEEEGVGGSGNQLGVCVTTATLRLAGVDGKATAVKKAA